jgi:hypothetical protein
LTNKTVAQNDKPRESKAISHEKKLLAIPITIRIKPRLAPGPVHPPRQESKQTCAALYQVRFEIKQTNRITY